jgi:hypothetical protein
MGALRRGTDWREVFQHGLSPAPFAWLGELSNQSASYDYQTWQNGGCHGLTLDFSSFPRGASTGVFRYPSLACGLAE